MLLKQQPAKITKYLAQHIEDYWLDPAAPKNSFIANYNLENPPWAKIGRWGDAQEFLIKYFDGFQVNLLFFNK